MQKESWCLRVHRSVGEQVRKELIDAGVLERYCRIRSVGDELLIPVTREIPGAVVEEFTCIPPPPELVRFEQVGGIAIMQDDDPVAALDILASRSTFHTVVTAQSAVEGPFRTKQYRVLAGKDTTFTEYTEYGLRFFIDISLAYFSARLSGERQRVLQMMKEDERVIDMFAGVGPFAITLAQKASVVYANDLNPDAVLLLAKNIELNRSRNIVPLLADAGHLSELITVKADRVIMNLPLHSVSFLSSAFELCRPGGMIHMYALVGSEDELITLLQDFPIASVQTRFVRSYSPDRFHVVYDIVRGDTVNGG